MPTYRYVTWTQEERNAVAGAIAAILLQEPRVKPTPSNIRAVWRSVQQRLVEEGKLAADRMRASQSYKDEGLICELVAAATAPVVPDNSQELLAAIVAYKAEFGPDADPVADARKWRQDQMWRLGLSPQHSGALQVPIVKKHNPAPAQQSAPRPKLQVAVLGVHPKHWSQLENDACKGVQIIWGPQNMNDREIKGKVSGRDTVILSVGVNSRILATAKSMSRGYQIAEGLKGVLTGIRFFKEQHDRKVIA